MYYMLQVANYMNGGHYNPHTDYVMREKVPDHVRHKFSVELVSSCSWGMGRFEVSYQSLQGSS